MAKRKKATKAAAAGVTASKRSKSALKIKQEDVHELDEAMTGPHVTQTQQMHYQGHYSEGYGLASTSKFQHQEQQPPPQQQQQHHYHQIEQQSPSGPTMTSSVAELNDIQHDNGRGKGKASQHEGRVEGEAGGSRAALAAGEEEDQPQYNSHGIDMAAAYSSVSQIEATPFTDPETGEAIYPCPFCDKQYGGKHARSIWRRHLSNKHDIPLNVQPRRTRWDNDTNRPKDEAERHKRTLESKRRWAAKNRAEKRARKKGLKALDSRESSETLADQSVEYEDSLEYSFASYPGSVLDCPPQDLAEHPHLAYHASSSSSSKEKENLMPPSHEPTMLISPTDSHTSMATSSSQDTKDARSAPPQYLSFLQADPTAYHGMDPSTLPPSNWSALGLVVAPPSASAPVHKSRQDPASTENSVPAPSTVTPSVAALPTEASAKGTDSAPRLAQGQTAPASPALPSARAGATATSVAATATASTPGPGSAPALELNFIPYERVPQRVPQNRVAQLQGHAISTHLRGSAKSASLQRRKSQNALHPFTDTAINTASTPQGSLQRSLSAPGNPTFSHYPSVLAQPEPSTFVASVPSESFLQPVHPTQAPPRRPSATFFLAPPPLPRARSIPNPSFAADIGKVDTVALEETSLIPVQDESKEAPTRSTAAEDEAPAMLSRKKQPRPLADVDDAHDDLDPVATAVLHRNDSKAEAALQLLALRSSSPPVSPTAARIINDSGFAEDCEDEDDEDDRGQQREVLKPARKIVKRSITSRANVPATMASSRRINPATQPRNRDTILRENLTRHMSLSPTSSPIQHPQTVALPAIPAGTPTKRAAASALDGNDENAGYGPRERISLDSSPDGPPIQRRRLLPSSPTSSAHRNRSYSYSHAQPSSSAATNSSIQTPYTNFHHYKLGPHLQSSGSVKRQQRRRQYIGGPISTSATNNDSNDPNAAQTNANYHHSQANIFKIDTMSRPSAGLGVLSSPANFLLSSPEHAAVSKSLGLVPETFQPSAFDLQFLDGYEGGISEYAAGVFGPKSDD